MAKQRVVNTHFWNDDYILDLSAPEKLLFLYILTNPQTDICGAYQIAIKRMSFDTALPENLIKVALQKFREAGKIYYEDGWMVVRNFIKHQAVNPKVALGIVRSLSACPDWIKDRLSIDYQGLYIEYDIPKPQLKPKPTDADVADAPSLVPFSKPSNTLRGVPATAAARELDTWLAAVATALGARGPNALAQARKWSDACQKAILNSYPLDQFIAALNSERERLRDCPQFFSAEGVLKKIQLDATKAPMKKFAH